jgi:hypothetical protein
MPLVMALAIADECTALLADLSALANADLRHGGTSGSYYPFDAGCRLSQQAA